MTNDEGLKPEGTPERSGAAGKGDPVDGNGAIWQNKANLDYLMEIISKYWGYKFSELFPLMGAR
jgi:hypothetical protein